MNEGVCVQMLKSRHSDVLVLPRKTAGDKGGVAGLCS